MFAKVPGVFVYDMDGTGNQINIATRGLDPHRGWEFNIGRNDALTNSDISGYPANRSIGKVPSYGLIDINASWSISDHARLNINNVPDKQYFTKRPEFYPGPGIWPSDGRSINFTLGFEM